MAASDATLRKTLHPEDMVDQLAAKRAENRIVAEMPRRVRAAVRAMLQRLRRRRLGG